MAFISFSRLFFFLELKKAPAAQSFVFIYFPEHTAPLFTLGKLNALCLSVYRPISRPASRALRPTDAPAGGLILTAYLSSSFPFAIS